MADVALAIDVQELLSRDPITVTDWYELRREVYRTETSRDQFLAMIKEKFGGEKDAWRRGLGLMAAGRVEEAAPLLASSSDPLARFLQGRAALDRDDGQRARELLEPISGKEQPNDYRLAYADAVASVEDVEGLRKIAADLHKDDARGADAAYVEGRIREIEGDYGAAIEFYERAIATQPDHGPARFRLAYRLDLMGRDDDAIAHYERIKQIFPVPIGVLINLGVLYEDHENYEKALSCFRLALAHDYNHPRARMFAVDAQSSLEMFYDEEKERKDDKRAQIMKIPVTDFELSVRSRNCLARMNIRSLGDLIKKTEAELLSFKNFGETSLNEIKEILRSKGLRLGMQSDDDDRRGRPRSRSIDRDSIRAKTVAELDLSVRSRKALSTLNINTVGQLVETTEDQLLSCKNFGQTSLIEIKKKLADFDLSLRG